MPHTQCLIIAAALLALQLPLDHPVYDSWHVIHSGRLQEVLGHTVAEVIAGGGLGLTLGFLLQTYLLGGAQPLIKAGQGGGG